MEVWHIWIIAALVLVIIEIFTSGFAVICLSVGAVGGAIAAACDCSFKIQLLAFALASFVALIPEGGEGKDQRQCYGGSPRYGVQCYRGRRGWPCRCRWRGLEGSLGRW